MQADGSVRAWGALEFGGDAASAPFINNGSGNKDGTTNNASNRKTGSNNKSNSNTHHGPKPRTP